MYGTSSHDSAVAAKVEAKRIGIFVDRQLAGALTSPLGTVLLAWIGSSGAGWTRTAIWLAIINIVEALILLVAFRHRPTPDTQRVMRRTLAEMRLVSLLVGIAWGSSVWFFGPAADFESYLFNFTVLIGVAGVCLMIFAPDRVSLVMFYSGLLLLPAVHVLLGQQRYHLEMAAGLVVVFILMTQYGMLAGKQLIREFETNARLDDALALLKDSEHRLSAIFATSPVAIVVSTLEEGRVLDINQAGLEMAGVERSALVGKTADQVGAYVDPAQRNRIVEQLRREGQVRNVESEFRRPDGQIRTHLVSARIAEMNGAPVVLTARQDITDRKLAEARLRELSQAVEQSPSSVCITDIDGRISQANAAFLRTCGQMPDDPMGGDMRIAWSARLSPGAVAELRETMARGASWSGEFTHRRKDGRESVEFVRISPIREPDGSVSRFLYVGEDVTENRRMAAELDAHRHHLEDLVQQRTGELQQARIQADAANVAKSAFLANISHEIRTPMNAITGMVHLIKRGGVGPKQAEQLDKIETASRHLLEVINAVLDLSKIEAGKFSLEEAEIDVAGIAGNVVAILAEKARARNVALRVEQDALPGNLLGDRARLQQALLNYAANALKFTERGSVTLRTNVISESADGVVLRFEVEDTGVGIEPEILSRLFARFEQGDNSMTRRFGGTGLGLAITRHLAELMGGEAGVESARGKGSRFWFTARLKKGPTQRMASGHETDRVNTESILRKRYPGRRVLVVDDDEVNRSVAEMLLQGAGFRVDTASDGQAAVSMVQAADYDLIFMDMQMPNLDGLAATRKIRHLPGSEEVPIIAMTANSFVDDRKSCLDAGMNDFLSKPFDPERLFAVSLKWLPALHPVA